MYVSLVNDKLMYFLNQLFNFQTLFVRSGFLPLYQKSSKSDYPVKN